MTAVFDENNNNRLMWICDLVLWNAAGKPKILEAPIWQKNTY